MEKVEMVRLIADEGKELINGDVKANCVDTFPDKVSEWVETVKEENKEAE